MPRSLRLVLLAAFLFTCGFHSKSFAQNRAKTVKPDELEGVYEFISERVELTQPEKVTGERTQSDWAGIWQFQQGYYTRVMMKRVRENFFDFKKYENFGFESFAGPYKVDGNKVQLVQTLAVHPFDVDRSAIMEYRIDGDSLTLVQRLVPYLENLSEGMVTTVLRRKR